MVALESSSPEETEQIAARVAAHLSRVTSPTYTIGHRYPGSPDVSHLDLYRFDTLTEDDWGDIEAYFDDAVVFVEWPEHGAGYLPEPRVSVRLRLLSPEHRLIELEMVEKSLEIAISSPC
jgi:tRNA threonylcarbamoyladenosine biosynthesis protein TsaE